MKISSRKLLGIAFLVSGTLAWFFVIWVNFDKIFVGFTGNSFWASFGKALFLSSSAFSAIIGAVISERINRRKLLWLSIGLGVLITLALSVFQGIVFALLSSVLLGVSLGLMYPCGTAFLADSTVVEERARVAGIIILGAFGTVTVAVVIATLLDFGLLEIVVLCALLRATSFLSLFLDPCNRELGKEKSWRSILTNRDFVFYLLPWLLFNVASGLASFVWLGLPKTQEFTDAIALGNILHLISPGIFGLISGFVADHVGRKQPIVVGLVLLGASFAFLGLATSSLSVLVYLFLSGIAWGFLSVIYLAIPGDLSSTGSKEKFYAVGVVVPLVIYMGFSVMSEMIGIFAPAYVLSSILSVILFVCIIPVLYAKETLSGQKMRERKMKEYVDKVGKVIQESRKTQNS